VTLEEALVDLTYTTSFTVSVGKTYSFKIEARNSVGYSAYSSVLQVLAADKPGQPGTPTTVS
jgi:phosphoribosylformylglycinamidine (FGAM) synthase PurS component